jgi:hypothetical protein
VSRLHLRFDPEDEWHGQLIATVSSNGFEGRSTAWFATDELRRFSRALTAYPLRSEAPPHISGGFGSEPGAPEPEQVHLSVDVAPHDVRGRLRITVRLATEVWRTQDSDLGCNATVRFVATYGDIAPFSSAVLALAEGQVEEAVLQSSSE